MKILATLLCSMLNNQLKFWIPLQKNDVDKIESTNTYEEDVMMEPPSENEEQ